MIAPEEFRTYYHEYIVIVSRQILSGLECEGWDDSKSLILGESVVYGVLGNIYPLSGHHKYLSDLRVTEMSTQTYSAVMMVDNAGCR